VAPREYKSGEKVELKVNKLTSVHTQLPYDYYSHKFCKPHGGVKTTAENLGEFLSGDRIENSPFGPVLGGVDMAILSLLHVGMLSTCAQMSIAKSSAR
jgi:hypothetical protein